MLDRTALATAVDLQKRSYGLLKWVASAIQTGMKEGMIDMDSSIRKLYNEKKVTARAAYDKAIDKESFKDILQAEGIRE